MRPFFGRYRGELGPDRIRYVDHGAFPLSDDGRQVSRIIEIEDWSEIRGASLIQLELPIWQFFPLAMSPESGPSPAAEPVGDPATSPDLRSIASLYYEPVWLFVRGNAPERLSALRGKRVAIGVNGSGTRAAALELLAANGVDGGNASFVALGGKDAAAALKAS